MYFFRYRVTYLFGTNDTGQFFLYSLLKLCGIFLNGLLPNESILVGICFHFGTINKYVFK